MNWIQLDSETVLNEALQKSHLNKGIIIFKHSTRCSISAVAKTRLSLKWNLDQELLPYHLDLIKHRELSNLIAEKFNIYHESPQLLLIKNGKCLFNVSHLGISLKKLKEQL